MQLQPWPSLKQETIYTHKYICIHIERERENLHWQNVGRNARVEAPTKHLIMPSPEEEFEACYPLHAVNKTPYTIKRRRQRGKRKQLSYPWKVSAYAKNPDFRRGKKKKAKKETYVSFSASLKFRLKLFSRPRLPPPPIGCPFCIIITNSL